MPSMTSPTDSVKPFSGFSRQSFQFFTELIENNNREWFLDNKARYERHVIEPAQGFISSLGTRLSKLAPGTRFDTRANGQGSIFRIYRDVRFSKDKTPYKTHLGVLFWHGDRKKKVENPSWYFALDGNGAMFFAGLHTFGKDALDAYRRAVAGRAGSSLAKQIESLKAAGYIIDGESYKRVPRGFDPEHPRANLLRHSGLGIKSPKLLKKEITSAALLDACEERARNTLPVVRWLSRHVAKATS